MSATQTDDTYIYIGEELQLFSHARNWKAYFRSQILPYFRGDLLEVGGGVGTTAEVLADPCVKRWVSLEPDPRLLKEMQQRFEKKPLPVPCEPRLGTIENLGPEEKFDTIIYIDVLEHIEDDAAELARAGERLKPGGAIVILAPAHQSLYSPFDKAIGHFRRYNRARYREITPPTLKLERSWYLDSVGLLASTGNKLLLKSGMPTLGQIKFWDGCLVRASTFVDPLLGRNLGKTVIGVWRLK